MVMTREKEAAQRGVTAAADGLVAVSHELWDNPELAFEEFHSAEVCSDATKDAPAPAQQFPESPTVFHDNPETTPPPDSSQSDAE